MANVTKIVAKIGTGHAARTITVRGRTAWCFNELLESRTRGGFTTLEAGPALRVSDYIFKLRKRGVPVSTVDEKHGGTYHGRHGRYLLPPSVPIEIIEIERAAA